MKIGHITAVISIASVLVMFIWGYLAPGSPSWLAVIVGALISAIVAVVMDRK